MLSKKKLFEYLNGYYRVSDYGLEHNMIENETYGRKSMIYINCGKEMRGNLSNSLTVNGFKVSPRYGYEFGRLEVQVSYFQGARYGE